MSDEPQPEAPAPEPFRVTEPGFYAMTQEQYHADPCHEPSLSSSIAWELCSGTAARAMYRHPRLNPHHVEEEREQFDVGTAAHQIVLEGSSKRVRVVLADDWRTNAAKEARDQIRAEGNLPLLGKVWGHVQGMTDSLRAQLASHVDGRKMFLKGKPELAAIWTESVNGQTVWCRALLDYLRDDGIDDYKTTKGSANPEQVSRNMATSSWLMQSTFYRRGVQILSGDRPFFFAVQECYEPYLVSINAPGPSLETLGQKQLLFALDRWQRCLDANFWPGYGDRTAYATLPPYVEEQWLRKEMEVEFGV